LAAQSDTPQFGVYVHWPFCLSKCPYCDFNSHVRRAAVDESRFVRAFEAEIASTAARVPDRTVSTIFFGGGTPSLMQPTTVAAILDAIARHWSVAPDAEVSLEANPTSVEAARFRGYRTKRSTPCTSPGAFSTAIRSISFTLGRSRPRRTGRAS
jgi:oxygen-independent coproporphyrinogen-3 oxidase